jgi:hypothetical protein
MHARPSLKTATYYFKLSVPPLVCPLAKFSVSTCQSTASCIINIAKLWISLSFLTRYTLLSRKANKFGMLFNLWTIEKEKQKVNLRDPLSNKAHIDQSSVIRQRNQQRN